jgi:hypothetical protein
MPHTRSKTKNLCLIVRNTFESKIMREEYCSKAAGRTHRNRISRANNVYPCQAQGTAILKESNYRQRILDALLQKTE